MPRSRSWSKVVLFAAKNLRQGVRNHKQGMPVRSTSHFQGQHYRCLQGIIDGSAPFNEAPESAKISQPRCRLVIIANGIWQRMIDGLTLFSGRNRKIPWARPLREGRQHRPIEKHSLGRPIERVTWSGLARCDAISISIHARSGRIH